MSVGQTAEVEAVARRLEKTRKEPQGSEHGRNVDTLKELLQLDQVIFDCLEAADEPGSTGPLRVLRTPMDLGLGSLFLNRVEVVRADQTVEVLVEKGVRSTNNEAAFWTRSDVSRLLLDGDGYRTVAPLTLHVADAVAVMYFPYVAGLDMPKRSVKNNFRTNLDDIVASLAELNVRNALAPGIEWQSSTRHRLAAEPPRLDSLERHLEISSNTARLFRNLWAEIVTHWPDVASAYAHLPAGLCHNDVGPGNAIQLDDATRFMDFAMAGPAPIGSDLHSVIRWSGDPLTDPGPLARIFDVYVGSARAVDATIEREQVERAAWTTYFMRYSNLKWKSARSADAYALGLQQMRSLVADHV